MSARLGWLAIAGKDGSYDLIWAFNQSAGFMGAFPDGRAPRPKRFIAIAAFIIRFSPEQRLLYHKDRLSGIMRNGQIV
jgi:hypothetical protein